MDHVRFDAADATLILACAKGAPPSVIYWGAALPENVDAAQMAMVQVAKDLAARGEIMMAGQGGDDELVY